MRAVPTATPQAPQDGGRGPHAPRGGRGRLGVVGHMPRYAGVVGHAPHARAAIRVRRRHPARKIRQDAIATLLGSCIRVV